MLQKTKFFIIFIVLAGLLVCGYAVLAEVPGTGTPGSDSDPLVSKSFVEKYIQDFVKNSSGDWQIVQLSSGKVLSCGSGTEFVVRSGKAVAVDSTGNGISDLTDGINVMAGQTVAKNHLFLVPRSDGRGVKAVDMVWIMYKGSSVDVK